MGLSRRQLLERSGLFALSTAVWPGWMPRMVFRREDQAAAGDILVVVFARGGYDGLNMVIPYGDGANYFDRRRAIAIPEPGSSAPGKGIDLDGFFGIHPALGASEQGRWKEWFDGGLLAIVHAMHMADPTRSHFDAMDYMERGTPGQKALESGWLGRHLSSMASQTNSPFRAVGMGTMIQASLRGPVPAVALQSIADFHLQGRQDEIARFQQHLQSLYAGDQWLDLQGQSTFAALEMLQASIGGSGYVPSNGARYQDNNGFHRGLMQIAQLIKAEVGLEVACIDIGGWDTHANQVDAANPAAGTMATLMNSLATGVTAFMTDLWPHFDPTDRLAQGVTIMIMSEFGRRAGENGGRGTDHGHGNVMYCFGKGINGGQVYVNPWPGMAEEQLDRGDLAGTTEYRNVLGEILSKRAGNRNVSQVFPSHTFDFLNLAKSLSTAPAPTAAPTETPEPVPTTPPSQQFKIFLPKATK